MEPLPVQSDFPRNAGVVSLPANDVELSDEAVVSVLAVFVIVSLILIGFYAFFAFSLQTIADKTETEGSWMAWLPFFQIY